MNEGKKFEEDFKKSVPLDFFYYRLRDNAASFSGGDNVRFTSHNICDCLIMAKDKLYLLELKSHKGSSLPLNCIRPNQLEGLVKAESYKNVYAAFVINFRDKEKTFIISANKLYEFIGNTTRKSIPIKFIESNGKEIRSERKKVRYRYDLEFLKELEEIDVG